MRRLLAVILITPFLSTVGQAHLGDTEQQLEARYGKPTPSEPTSPGSDETVTYWKDRIRITVELVKGRCMRIHYMGGGPNDYIRADKLATAKANPANGVHDNGSIVFTLVEWQKDHDKAIQDAKNAEKAAEEARIKKLKEGL
jgi:hypothetical protein